MLGYILLDTKPDYEQSLALDLLENPEILDFLHMAGKYNVLLKLKNNTDIGGFRKMVEGMEGVISTTVLEVRT